MATPKSAVKANLPAGIATLASQGARPYFIRSDE
jgi:hypothetical protein